MAAAITRPAQALTLKSGCMHFLISSLAFRSIHRSPIPLLGRLPELPCLRFYCGGGDVRPNSITGANAAGPRQFPVRTSLAARAAQFQRWGEEKIHAR